MKILFNIRKISPFVLFASCFLFLMSTSSLAADQTINISELKSFIDSGVVYFKQVGAEKAFKEFSDVKGKFVKKGKYFFVYNLKGECLAHGGNPTKHIGKNLLSFKDKFGEPVIQSLIDIAKSGGGFAGYYWPNPKLDGQEQFRIAYVKMLDDKVFIGSGFFIE